MRYDLALGRRLTRDDQSSRRLARSCKDLSTPRFSARFPGSAPPNALSGLLNEKRQKGELWLDLTTSNPTDCAFLAHSPKLLKTFTKKANLKYSPDPRGDLAARQAVCGYYKKKGTLVRPEQVFLTASTSEAYHFLFRLLADAGETVACAEPSYPLFDTLAALDDVMLKKYRLIYDDHWRIELDSFRRVVSGARAVLAVHPNNPTGHFITDEERKTMNQVCGTEDVPLIVDEVFLDYFWDGKKRPSFADNKIPTFTLSGVSKVLGLPQMKLSWIVVSGPESFRVEACERLETIADATLSVNTPAQTALPGWLSSGGTVVNEILRRVRANRRHLEKEMDLGEGEVLNAEGGWVSILRFHAEKNDEEMALHLLKDKNLLVHPGYLYDLPSERMLAISMLPPEKIFREGIRLLKEGLV